jgi:respiratory nitrate reductase gamma subunit
MDWQLLLHVILPYAAIATFFVAHFWRYRRDQYRWTARSTQLLESRALRVGSMAFHYGALAAIAGHVMGILVPAAWTEAVGITEGMYHVIAGVGGMVAGLAVLFGLGVLVWRRSVNRRARATTTRMDVAVFVLLALGIVTGLWVTVLNNITDDINYRENVAPWFRSLLILNPDVERMDGVHWMLQTHVVVAWFLYALWPFSRLVHAWSIPVDWFRRSPVLFRGRPGRPTQVPPLRPRAKRPERQPAGVGGERGR